MQRVYGEFIVESTNSNDIVQEIKEQEKSLNLNPVPEKFFLRKLGIKPTADCEVSINGRVFKLAANEALEFGYESIKVDSIIFKTTGVEAVIRYMYFREDRAYQ